MKNIIIGFETRPSGVTNVESLALSWQPGKAELMVFSGEIRELDASRGDNKLIMALTITDNFTQVCCLPTNYGAPCPPHFLIRDIVRLIQGTLFLSSLPLPQKFKKRNQMAGISTNGGLKK